MKRAAAPRVGEVWTADIRGKVDWADSALARPGPVRLTWVADDLTVVEGFAFYGKRHPQKVVLARCLLVRRVSA